MISEANSSHSLNIPPEQVREICKALAEFQEQIRELTQEVAQIRESIPFVNPFHETLADEATMLALLT